MLNSMMTWNPLNSMRKINQGQWGKVLWTIANWSWISLLCLHIIPQSCLVCNSLLLPVRSVANRVNSAAVLPAVASPDLDLSNPWDPWYYFLVQRTKLDEILDNKRFHGVAEPPRNFRFDQCLFEFSVSQPGWDQWPASPKGPGNVCFQFGDTYSNLSCWIKLLLPQKVRGSGLVRPSKYTTWCYSS